MHIRKMFLSTLFAAIVFYPIHNLQAADQSINDRQKMSELIPQQVVMYLQWPGRDKAKTMFTDTEFMRLWAEPQMQHFSNTWQEKTWPSIKQAIFRQMPHKAVQVTRELLPFLHAAWEHPSALSLINVEMGAMGPTADLALIIRGGEQAEELEEQFENVLAATGMGMAMDDSNLIEVQNATFKQLRLVPSLPVRWSVFDDKFIVTLGTKLTGHLMDLESKSLNENTRFQTAAEAHDLDDNPPFMFIDYEGIYRINDNLQPLLAAGNVSIFGQPGGMRKFMQEQGLTEEAFSMSAQAEADGICYKMLTHDPDPATSRFLKDIEPVTKDQLRMIPRQVYWAGVGNITSPVEIYDYMLESIKLATQPADMPADADFDKLIRSINEAIGYDLREDLLAKLGNKYIAYDSPQEGGVLFTGMTVRTAVEPGANLADKLSEAIANLAVNYDIEKYLATDSENYRNHRIHFLNVKGLPIPLAPAWCEHDGYLVLGSFPQMVRFALDQTLDQRESILDNPDFQRARKLLPQDVFMISYSNNRLNLRKAYGLLLIIKQTTISLLQRFDIEADITLVPSLSTFEDHLFGGISGSVVTENGLMMTSHGPWVMDVPSSSLTLPFVAGAASVALPSFARARTLSRRTVSAANLNCIGTAATLWSEEHNQQFPENMDTLVKIGAVSPRTLISPNDPDEKNSYIYIPAQKTSMTVHNILAYEDPAINHYEGTNVLYLDSHVEWKTFEDFQSDLRGTLERLDRRMPDNLSYPYWLKDNKEEPAPTEPGGA